MKKNNYEKLAAKLNDFSAGYDNNEANSDEFEDEEEEDIELEDEINHEEKEEEISEEENQIENYPNNKIVKFKDQSVAVYEGERIGQSICPFCKKDCDILMDTESSFLTYLGSLVAMVLFGLYSIFILPLLVQSSKTVVHRCSECGQILEQKDLFSMPSLSDPVFNFRFGNCAMIISRKYAIIIVILFSLFFLWRYVTKPPAPIPEPTSKFLHGVKWESYIEECGSYTFMKNGLRAKQNFDKFYLEKMVKWTGVHLLSRGSSNGRFSEYSKILFIKMNPSDSKADYPDITMLVPHDVYDRYKDIILSLEEYEEVLFTASFFSLGDEFSLHMMKLLHIEKTGSKLLLENFSYIEFKPASGNLRKSG